MRADAASNAEIYEKVKNGAELCAETNYQNGGLSTPLYNYASASRTSDPFCQGDLSDALDMPKCLCLK